MDDDTILHQDDVEAVIEDVIDANDNDYVIKLTGGATIAVPASPGSSYVQAEVVALRTAISQIIAALHSAGVIEP